MPLSLCCHLAPAHPPVPLESSSFLDDVASEDYVVPDNSPCSLCRACVGHRGAGNASSTAEAFTGSAICVSAAASASTDRCSRRLRILMQAVRTSAMSDHAWVTVYDLDCTQTADRSAAKAWPPESSDCGGIGARCAFSGAGKLYDCGARHSAAVHSACCRGMSRFHFC